jgi:hypothetical protein
MRSVLMSRVTEVMQKAEKLKNHNMDYAYIWTDSRAEYMHYFLTYSRQLTQEVCTYKLEIVMKELRKLMMSAGFFLQIHPMICVGVQECKVLLYIGGM